METENAVYGRNLEKKFKYFRLTIPEIRIPKGYVSALIGENGAGKSTLMNCMSGVRLDYQGEFEYFDQKHSMANEEVKEEIGFVSPNQYYLPAWTIGQVREASGLLFDHYDDQKFAQLMRELSIDGDDATKITKLSDGNQMKLMLAGVLARETRLLILDEPASPLDPLMREKLCDMIRNYISDGAGERTVFFSTHNVADMENVTDYCMIMEQGEIVECGFVEELKEKYVSVKGDAEALAAAKDHMISFTSGEYGFEGLAEASEMDALGGLNLSFERPTLTQISVGIMRKYSKLA